MRYGYFVSLNTIQYSALWYNITKLYITILRCIGFILCNLTRSHEKQLRRAAVPPAFFLPGGWLVVLNPHCMLLLAALALLACCFLSNFKRVFVFMWQEHQSVPSGLDGSHGVHRPHHAAQHGEVMQRCSPAHRCQSLCADRPIVCLFIKQTHQLIGCKSAAPPPPPHFTNLPVLSSPPPLHPCSTPPLCLLSTSLTTFFTSFP